MHEHLVEICLLPNVWNRFAVVYLVFIIPCPRPPLRILIAFYLFSFFNREFAKTIKRPFGVKYNPYTRSIQILKDTKSITKALNELRHDLDVVSDALAKVGRQPSIWQILTLRASEHQFRGLWASSCFSWRLGHGKMAAK